MFIRKDFAKISKRISEPRKFIQVIAGPRQVGKTTLTRQLLASLDVYSELVTAEESLNAGGAWIDSVWESIRAKMKLEKIKTAIIAFDEIQKITNWSEFVKRNWDNDSQNTLDIKIILLGSSRLLIQKGLTESLAGRFELSIIDHWSFLEMNECFGITEEEFAWFGAYPGAIELRSDEQRFKKYVNDAIIEPSISKDILMLENVSKPALLHQLFEIAAQYNSELLSYNKIMGRLQDAGNTTTLAHYTQLLDGAGMLASLDKFSNKKVIQKASVPKFQLQNMAMFSSQNVRNFEQALSDPEFWGRIVEGAIGAKLLAAVKQNSNLKLFYWRETIRKKSEEVDFVLQYGDNILAIEVKSKAAKNISGLNAFKMRYPSAKTLLISDIALTWKDFLQIDVMDLFV